MKRFLFCLLILLITIFLGKWLISSSESLPSKDSVWHSFKRELFTKALYYKRNPYANNHVPLSNVKIDIVILATEKDLATIGHAIDAVRGLVMHPINKIYLIGPESSKLRSIASEKSCEFVEEAKAMPAFASDHQLSSILRQQFLKLNADTICEREHYLVIDANVVLLQTQVFLEKNKAVLQATNHYVLQNKITTESALKLGQYLNLGFAGNHMFFEKTKLKAMKKRLSELHNNQAWQEVLNNLSMQQSSFSEYEMYANFVLSFFPNEVMVVYRKSAVIPSMHANGITWQRGFLSKWYSSITFNHFISDSI